MNILNYICWVTYSQMQINFASGTKSPYSSNRTSFLFSSIEVLSILTDFKTQHFTSTVSFTGLTWCCFICNILYCHAVSNKYLHLPLTFLRWPILDQLALSTDEGQLIARRCRLSDVANKQTSWFVNVTFDWRRHDDGYSTSWPNTLFNNFSTPCNLHN